MQVGCAELIGYTIGTASNVTGDLIIKQIEKMKDAENSPQETIGKQIHNGTNSDS